MAPTGQYSPPKKRKGTILEYTGTFMQDRASGAKPDKEDKQGEAKPRFIAPGKKQHMEIHQKAYPEPNQEAKQEKKKIRRGHSVHRLSNDKY